MTKELNDSLDDLIGSEKRAEPRQPPASYAAVQESYTEGCRKCGGTGNTRWGRCFACKGVGSKTFSTSPESRAKARTYNAERKANMVSEWKAAFKQAEPAVWAWLNEECDRFGFASAMLEAIATYGSLTEKQLATCHRLIEQSKARKQERAERTQSAPAVASAGVDRLKLAFDTAIAYARAKGRGLKQPRITIGTMVVSPAKADGKNPGALYVKSGASYLGKIVDGKFFSSRECSSEQQAKVLAFVADPKAAAEAYGIETGVCCICNATLTNKESIERGIGPICADKFGWS